MKIYNKLVRDRIPEIIRATGKECEIRALDNEAYLVELNKKLNEEIREYAESGAVEELADIIEVVYAIAEYKGLNREEFEKVREKKAEERGGFRKRLFLGRVMDV